MEEIKIEIGEYVRTKNGYILKNTIKEHNNIIDGIINQNEKYKYEFDNIEKHSKNLIDLIEEGDYVNGEKILEIRPIAEDIEPFKAKISKKEIAISIFRSSEGEYYRYIKEADIKNILTHEQFENRCYILEV